MDINNYRVSDCTLLRGLKVNQETCDKAARAACEAAKTVGTVADKAKAAAKAAADVIRQARAEAANKT